MTPTYIVGLSSTMDFTTINVEEFIQYIMTFNNVSEILEICQGQTEKGFIFERLWDICIKCGFCDHFQNTTFNHMVGNVNNGNIKQLTTFSKYLTEKVYSGNSSGCSDITLFNKITEEYIFISSKYPKTTDEVDLTKQKSVSYYDIQNIKAMINSDKNKSIYMKTKPKIYLLVPDKQSVFEKFKSANRSSEYITEEITLDHILDQNDLNKYFLRLKADIKAFCSGKINFDERYLSVKPRLTLRFHQELITQKTVQLIEQGQKRFLWGCKCRSGKTYMMGGIINKLFQLKNKLNVLIITPAPTETVPQFTDDLFNKFKEFEAFKIHNIEGSNALNGMILGESNIFVMSKQLLQKYTNTQTITKIKDLHLDLIGFDENHFSGTTTLSKEILQSYSSNNTVKVYLTATYNKPLREWNIPEEAQMYWDLEDEQVCKSQDLTMLKKKHGEAMVQATLDRFMSLGDSLNEIFEPYQKMPELYLLTTLFDQQRYEDIKVKIAGSPYGFCFDTLFSLSKDKKRFKFESEVKTILRFISGSNKEQDFKNGDRSMFSRIFRICAEHDSRTPFTQIWFLPSDNINATSECLSSLMKDDLVLKKYDVLSINRKNTDLVKDVKEEISRREAKAKAEGRDGLILLAGNMLTLGITLNLCDVVMLMNNASSSDKVLQQLYRCMTEGSNKKYGFVVDLNINRVLNTCVNYTIYKSEHSIEDKIRYLIEHHLINIDRDLLEQKKINSQVIISKLMEIWKSDPINSFKSLLRNIDNDYIEFDMETQRHINKLFVYGNAKGTHDSTSMSLKDSDDIDQELPSGKEIVPDDTNSSETSCTSDEDTDKTKTVEEIQISFTKDVLPYVIPLACILTIKSPTKDILQMLRDIKADPVLLEIFNDQSIVWWNKTNLIDIIINIIYEKFDKNSNTYNISVTFKMSLQSLIDRPKELLELINDCLKPKQKEKQENGEVFTPMDLIFEMLDNLDRHYKEENGKSIFTEKQFKWGNVVGCGMGNFSVAVYLRLMDGLQQEIPDEDDRKAHILNSMIYMAELNKKNVYVCRQVFDIDNRYHLSLYEGDALDLDPCVEWGVEQFDVIVGNGGIWSHTKKMIGEKREVIWMEFVKKSFSLLKSNGYLAFIHPLYWLKSNNEIHNNMLEKHITWLKLWDNSQSKCMINADIPISLYVLHNVKNISSKKTVITSVLKRRGLETTSIEYLNKKYSIPLAYHSIFNKLLNFIETNKLQLEYHTKTVKSVGKKEKVPSIYSLSDMWAVDTYTIKEGIMVKKVTIQHPDANKFKLIISNKASFTGAFIDEGKLSLTGTNKYYIIGEKLELIKKMLNFSIIPIIGNFTKYTQDFLDKEALSYLPDIRKLGLSDITEEEFYQLVGLTQQEVNQIKNQSKEKITSQQPLDIKKDEIEVDEKPISKKPLGRKIMLKIKKSVQNYF